MKRIPREKELAKEEWTKEKTLLVEAAMKNGCMTKSKICKAAKIKTWELNKLFTNDKELYAMFTVRRRTLVDSAADNIQDIIDDPDHPNYFAASKFVLQKYKSDLDKTLESHDVNPLEIEVPKAGSSKPVVIKFGSTKADKK